MKPWKIIAIITALVGMTGCAVYAPGPGPYYGEPAYYGGPTASVSVGVYGGGGHHHRY